VLSSDDLRTRIVDILQTQWTQLTSEYSWDEDCLTLADAVIRELGLKRQDSTFTTYDSIEPAAHRYVTDWIVNE
jgi:hypothetical protein